MEHETNNDYSALGSSDGRTITAIAPLRDRAPGSR